MRRKLFNSVEPLNTTLLSLLCSQEWCEAEKRLANRLFQKYHRTFRLSSLIERKVWLDWQISDPTRLCPNGMA
jgi:hypothetical protein